MAAATILVVDDDPAIVALVSGALEDEGYQVVPAVDGDAVAVAQALCPAVILLDIMMPGMDGVAVSQRLRADPTTAAIPIIAMSAIIDAATMATMAANDCLPKPFELDALYETVGRWLP